ncbi:MULTISPECIES: shikimate dehydrogenase [unclassified Gordonia (in: high G+C Gram-positive bacteria)]|uniref:shikimate dehydrogenase n=1 Tax=unclassified Gordonia (in: high G+C Gram-positive bacteria) TaxID=2657482 RepID=UPI0009AEACFE|nr:MULTISPECIES: shikimate dehydrogenase [unclassified Gordonia (in: high G+C Gram-positive bacteria)]MDF3282320.1 shikimate dehydrogenase [Gordonia sp. N1V]OPX14000.1 shikimate dehydrogenase [Gordonia sp. i37]
MFDIEFATAARRASGGAVVAALIGQGISRSLTPGMHEREAAHHGLDYTYLTLDVPASAAATVDLAALLARAADAGLVGLNVTHPFKQRILAHLDDLSPDAARLGAVNTVVFDGGRAIGHNTDWSGFARSFDRGLGAGLGAAAAPRKSVVQIGAGGAGAAVAYAVLTTGVAHFHLVDTDTTRAAGLAATLRAMFDAEITSGGVDSVAAALAGADGLVHATPIGMAHHPGIAVDPALLRADLWVADVVYRPAVTELIASARAVGARTLPGDGMAVGQAVDALRLFTGIEPDADRMAAHIAELIAAEDLAERRTA